ncbi:MAG: hypothetical protein RL885_16960 [Planctomycetota bacterium]
MIRFAWLLTLLVACSGPDDSKTPEEPKDTAASAPSRSSAAEPESSEPSESESKEMTSADPSEPFPYPHQPGATQPEPGSGPQFQMKPEGAPSGWQSQPEEISEEELAGKPLTEAERKQYSEIARKLVQAINAEDREAYRALHTDAAWSEAIDWWRDMFPQQIARFGRISKAWTPVREMIRFGGMGFRGGDGNMVTLVIRFEEPMGGALSFELDDAGKIQRTSVYIKEELAHYAPEGEKAKLIYELK